MTDQRVIISVSAVSTGFVLLGILDLDYWFYNLLRVILCGSALAIGFIELENREPLFLAPLGAVALLYNPIFPVHLGDKSIWIVLNIITIAYFWSFLVLKRRRTSQEAPVLPGWTEQEMADAKIKISNLYKVSSRRSLPALDGVEVKADCAKCKKRFKFVSGKITILERENGQPALLCKSCFEELNGWREDLGLEKIPMNSDGYI
jgi:hypothetical protein